MSTRGVGGPFALVAGVVSVLALCKYAAAAVGDQITDLDLPVEAHCSSVGTSVALIPATAIDETYTFPFIMATSCYSSDPGVENKIIYTNVDNSTAPPTLAYNRTITVTGVTNMDRGIGSMTLRGDRGDLLLCTNNVSGDHWVYKMNVKTGAATELFKAAHSRSDVSPPLEICDGLAWDALTDTVYTGGDIDKVIYTYQLNASDAVISRGTPDGADGASGTFPFRTAASIRTSLSSSRRRAASPSAAALSSRRATAPS